MLVCGCGKEMRCIKTGMNVVVDVFTYYRGDLYECPNCRFRLAKTNEHSAISDKKLEIGPNDIKLKKEFE